MKNLEAQQQQENHLAQIAQMKTELRRQYADRVKDAYLKGRDDTKREIRHNARR